MSITLSSTMDNIDIIRFVYGFKIPQSNTDCRVNTGSS